MLKKLKNEVGSKLMTPVPRAAERPEDTPCWARAFAWAIRDWRFDDPCANRVEVSL